jgi:hypothetical protein
VRTLLHATVRVFYTILQNVLVQIANKMRLQKNLITGIESNFPKRCYNKNDGSG